MIDEYGNAIIDSYSISADVATNYHGGETIETNRGKYGYYHYIDDLGARKTYNWAQRSDYYGHRQFGTLDECKRYVSGENI